MAWLGRHRSPAAEKYEEIRKKLVMFFSCYRRPDAEDLADCVIDRVARKVPTIAEEFKGDPAPYFLKVARFVLLEQSRKPRHVVPKGELPDPAPQFDREARGGDKEECLQLCLKRLPSNSRELIIGYYRELGPIKKTVRRTLASKARIGINALRIRVYRIRKKLTDCWRKCVETRVGEARE